MRKDKVKEAEDLFKVGYQMMEDERDTSLMTEARFLKPLKKSARLGNPKANFLLGYILVVGYKDMPIDVEQGNRILKKWFKPLKDSVELTNDYQACKFLSEYYRVPLANHVKDDIKVKSLLTLSDTYRASSINQPIEQEEKLEFDKGTKLDKADNMIYDQLIRAVTSLDEENSYDSKETINSLDVSARNGNMRASLFLGDCYLEGKYVVKNPNVAIEYYQMAEKLGSLKAKYRIGKYLLEGDFPKADIVSGLNKIYQAAKGGLPEAQYYLGLVYFNGTYINKDLEKSYVYFQAALTRNYKDAKEYLRLIEEQQGDALLINKSIK